MNKTAKMSDRIKLWMDSSDELPTAEEMAKILGGERSSVTARMSELRREGYTVTPTRTGYVVTERPERRQEIKEGFASRFIGDVQEELGRARGKFDWWPQNPVEAAAIVNEEAGEVVKGINNWHHGHGDDTPEEIYKEAVQAAAMLVRFVTETPLFRGMWEDLK